MLSKPDEDFHQMTIEELLDNGSKIKPNLFAVSRVFSQARKQMNMAEFKAFSLALSSVRWKEPCPDVLYLDKKTVANIVGVTSDSDHLSQDLKRSIGDLPAHSFLKFSDKDSGEWVNGCFINTMAFYKNRVRIRMNPDFLGLFGNLDNNFITLWSTDIYNMTSERSIKLYETLRENTDTRKDVQQGELGIKAFKEMFNIPKEGDGSYMRCKEHGGFNRDAFEKYVINPAFADLSKTDMIRIILQPDGKFYEKVYRGRRVIAYRFFWTFSSHPRVATAAEVKDIRETIDADARVLKIAKDIVSSKQKKKSNGAKKSTFNTYSHEEIDWDAAAQKIMQREQKN